MILSKYYFLLLAAAIFVMPYSLTAEDILLIKQGKPLGAIYVDATEWAENPKLQFAVQELNYHFSTMSGAELPLKEVKELEEIEPPAVVLGRLAETGGVKVAKPDNPLSTGGFHLKTDNGSVWIAGVSSKGVLNGVYELLERLGCAWVMPGALGERIPEMPDVEIASVDVEKHPAFALATLGISAINYFDKQQKDELETWKRRMRLDDNEDRKEKFDEALVLHDAFAWSVIMKRYADDFEKNPELLGWNQNPDGTSGRKKGKFETSNPALIDILVRYVRDTFEKKKWSKDKKVALSVGPSPGDVFSMSSATLAINEGRIDPMSGLVDRTNEGIYLANEVFTQLEDEFPNLYLGQHFYNCNAGPPSKNYPLHPRFVIGVMDNTYSRYHSAMDERSPSRSVYRSNMEQWAEISKKQGNPMYFGGFSWNLAEAILPYTKVQIWGEDIPFYHKHGFLLPTVKGMPAWAVLGPSDYIYARMVWDTDRSWKEELNKYALAAFGEKAGAVMEDIYLKQIARQNDARQEAGSFFAYTLIYSPEFTKDILTAFDKAEKLATTNQQKVLIRQQRHPWKQLKRYLAMRSEVQKFDYATANKLHAEMLAEHDRMATESVFNVSRSGRGYLETRFKDELTQGLKFSTNPYKIIYEVPDRLPVRFDPNNAGEQMRMFAADYNLDQLVRIATSSATWDAQGLPWADGGTVWYYFDFDGSKIPENSGVGLFLGKLETESKVWINEEFVGSKQGFREPHIHDITNAVIRDGKNRVAVAVHKTQRNEIGVAGLMAPSFVFVGPRMNDTKVQEELLSVGETHQKP